MLRDSLEAGTFEQDVFFGKLGLDEHGRLIKLARAAREHGIKLRREVRRDQARRLSVAERALAALTDTAIDVFVVICGLAKRTGEVFPSYDGLAEMTGRGRGNVARGLALLETAGFIVRQRRFRRVAGDGPGPRYEQTSNVYRPLLPKRILSLLPRWMRPAPVPVCEQQREVERLEEIKRQHAGLTCRELVRATISSGPLADVLTALGNRIEEGEARVPIPYATAG